MLARMSASGMPRPVSGSLRRSSSVSRSRGASPPRVDQRARLAMMSSTAASKNCSAGAPAPAGRSAAGRPARRAGRADRGGRSVEIARSRRAGNALASRPSPCENRVCSSTSSAMRDINSPTSATAPSRRRLQPLDGRRARRAASPGRNPRPARGENSGASDAALQRARTRPRRSAGRCRGPGSGPAAAGRPCGSWRRCRGTRAARRRDRGRRRASRGSIRPIRTGCSKCALPQISSGLRQSVRIVASAPRGLSERGG